MSVRSDQVCGIWVRVHEEDTEDEMVFRTAGTDLPPSRGRMAFELREDGTFAETGLGSADVPEQATGSWTLEGDTITLSKGATQGVPRAMEVVTVGDGKLVIHKRAARGS